MCFQVERRRYIDAAVLDDDDDDDAAVGSPDGMETAQEFYEVTAH